MVDAGNVKASLEKEIAESTKLFGGGWNHRILHEIHTLTDKRGTLVTHTYTIREVYYDADGNPNGYTEPTQPVGNTVDELARDICYLASAMTKPVLRVVDGKLVEEARE